MHFGEYGGLSLKIACANLKLSQAEVGPNVRVEVSVTVRNLSDVAADEVIQLYVRDPVAAVSRPVSADIRGGPPLPSPPTV